MKTIWYPVASNFQRIFKKLICLLHFRKLFRVLRRIDSVYCVLDMLEDPVFLRNIQSNEPKVRRILPFLAAGLKVSISEPHLRLIVGAGGSTQKGWVSTEQSNLDLLCPDEWADVLAEESLCAILAEHVWEHLTLDAGRRAAETCYRFLKSGGHLRIAVPDGFHPDANYIAYVKPGGCGVGAHDHKVLYNYQSLSDLLCSVGFQVELLEFFDEKGVFHQNKWNPIDGMINRSINFDDRNINGHPRFVSLLIDAFKPALEGATRQVQPPLEDV